MKLHLEHIGLSCEVTLTPETRVELTEMESAFMGKIAARVYVSWEPILDDPMNRSRIEKVTFEV